MRRVTYRSVLNRAAQYWLGITELSAEEAGTLNGLINKRLRTAWEFFFWPELCRVEQRQFRPSWASGTTYGAPTATEAVEIYFPTAKQYYQSLRSGNTGNAPASGTDNQENSAWWAVCRSEYSGDYWAASTAYAQGAIVQNPENQRFYQCHTAHTASSSFDATKFGILTPFVRWIEFFEDGQTDIGEVKNAWTSDPRVHRNPCREEFTLFETGFVVWGCAPVVWVQFRTLPPIYSGDPFNDVAIYAAGDQVYFTDGDYYLALETTSAGESPQTTPAKWERLDFPYVLAEAVAQGAYAEVLGKSDGQQEKYPAADAEFYTLLQRELDKIERQQGQAGGLRVVNR